MASPNYNYNSSSAWKNPKPKRNYETQGGGGDYQRFLEYLEQSGQGKNFQKKIINAHLFKGKQSL